MCDDHIRFAHRLVQELRSHEGRLGQAQVSNRGSSVLPNHASARRDYLDETLKQSAKRVIERTDGHNYLQTGGSLCFAVKGCKCVKDRTGVHPAFTGPALELCKASDARNYTKETSGNRRPVSSGAALDVEARDATRGCKGHERVGDG